MNLLGFSGLFAAAGWKRKRASNEPDENKNIEKQSLIEVDNQQAAELLDATFVNVNYLDTFQGFRDQAQKINDYRIMSQHPDVDMAVDDIICEMVASDDDEIPIQVDTSELKVSESVKKAIQDEYSYLLRLIDFNNTAYEKVRQWYVDGRIAFNVVIDENKPKEGIQKLVMLDPRSIKLVKEIMRKKDGVSGVELIVSEKNYYLFDPEFSLDNTAYKDTVSKTSSTTGYSTSVGTTRMRQKLKLTLDSVVLVDSGVRSAENNMILSHLEKAYKALNNVKMMEDSLLIYRYTRAPEKRAFYIDVGTLPKNMAEAYMANIIAKYKTTLNFDASSGKVITKSHQIALNEDYWLPRREGGRGTEVVSLPGGANLGEIDDVLLFKENLYKALNVPIGRLKNDDNFVLGDTGEISRDEWKFGKFVSRLRKRFNQLFLELLERQLILKGITTKQDWDDIIEPDLKFQYASIAYQKERDDIKNLENQIATYRDAKQLEGVVFSRDTLVQRIFRLTDEDQKLEREKIAKEIAEGLYSDPAQLEDESGNSF